MNPNEVKGINDLEVWLSENLSEFVHTNFAADWAKVIKHHITFDFMVGATRVETEVKELSMVPEGYKVVMRCEAKEALMEGMKIEPITLIGLFKTDRKGRIDSWEGQEIIR